MSYRLRRFATTGAASCTPKKARPEKALVSACQRIAKTMNAYIEVAGQRDARGSGSTIGLPDAFLYCAGHMVPVEFKVPPNTLSVPQAECMVRRLHQGVDTAVIRSEDEFVALINRCRRDARRNQ